VPRRFACALRSGASGFLSCDAGRAPSLARACIVALHGGCFGLGLLICPGGCIEGHVPARPAAFSRLFALPVAFFWPSFPPRAAAARALRGMLFDCCPVEPSAFELWPLSPPSSRLPTSFCVGQFPLPPCRVFAVVRCVASAFPRFLPPIPLAAVVNCRSPFALGWLPPSSGPLVSSFLPLLFRSPAVCPAPPNFAGLLFFLVIHRIQAVLAAPIWRLRLSRRSCGPLLVFCSFCCFLELHRLCFGRVLCRNPGLAWILRLTLVFPSLRSFARFVFWEALPFHFLAAL